MSLPSPRTEQLLQQLQEQASTQEEVAALFNRILEQILAPQHATQFWGDRMLTLDKSAGFLEEPGFAEAFQSIRGSHVYDQYAPPGSIAWRLHTLVWAARQALPLDGDYVECGVFKGDMSWVITRTVDLGGRGKTLYLYDTFAGYSDKYSSQEDFPQNPGFLAIANDIYRIPGLYQSVRDRFAPLPFVRVVQGVMPDALQEVAPERIAFLHIDLNSPAAELGVLDQLFDRVVPGGMIVFDDYGWCFFRKQKDAEDEFMRRRGYQILELPTGQGLVVKR